MTDRINENTNGMKDLKEIKEMLGELLWLNSVIATELIQIAENTETMPRNRANATANHKLRVEALNIALNIAERYKPNTGLKEHLLKHQ